MVRRVKGKRSGCAATVHEEKLVLVGAFNEVELASLEVLDLAMMDWSRGPPMRHKRDCSDLMIVVGSVCDFVSDLSFLYSQLVVVARLFVSSHSKWFVQNGQPHPSVCHRL